MATTAVVINDRSSRRDCLACASCRAVRLASGWRPVADDCCMPWLVHHPARQHATVTGVWKCWSLLRSICHERHHMSVLASPFGQGKTGGSMHLQDDAAQQPMQCRSMKAVKCEKFVMALKQSGPELCLLNFDGTQLLVKQHDAWHAD